MPGKFIQFTHVYSVCEYPAQDIDIITALDDQGKIWQLRNIYAPTSYGAEAAPIVIGAKWVEITEWSK